MRTCWWWRSGALNLQALPAGSLGTTTPSIRQALAYLRLGRLVESLAAVDIGLIDAPTGRTYSRLQLVASRAATALGAFDAAAPGVVALAQCNARGGASSGMARDRSRHAGSPAESPVRGCAPIVDATAPRPRGAIGFSSMTETAWWLMLSASQRWRGKPRGHARQTTRSAATALAHGSGRWSIRRGARRIRDVAEISGPLT